MKPVRMSRMRHVAVVTLTALACTACMPQFTHPRITRELTVPEAPAVAYARAVKATMAVQAQIHQQDATLGMIHATVQQGITLNVVITPQGTGSHIEVAHQVLATHIVHGPVTLSDAWITAYQQQT